MLGLQVYVTKLFKILDNFISLSVSVSLYLHMTAREDGGDCPSRPLLTSSSLDLIV